MKKILLFLGCLVLLGGLTFLSVIPSPLAQAADIVVNANSSGYQETGVWQTSSLPGYAGGPVRTSIAPGSTATWQFTVPNLGYYNVTLRFPGTTDGCKFVEYKLNGKSFFKNQQNGTASLGGFYLYPNTTHTVTVEVRSPILTMADAVVVTYVASSPPPTPLPSPCIWMSDYTIEAEGRPNSGVVDTGNGYITSCDDGDWVSLGGIQFYSCGGAIFEINASVTEESAGKTMEIRRDSPTGSLLGTFTLLGLGGNTPGFYRQAMWITAIPGSTSVSLYVVFKNGMNIADIDYFRVFSPSSTTKIHIGPTPPPRTPTPLPTVTAPPVGTPTPTVPPVITPTPPQNPTPTVTIIRTPTPTRAPVRTATRRPTRTPTPTPTPTYQPPVYSVTTNPATGISETSATLNAYLTLVSPGVGIAADDFCHWRYSASLASIQDKTAPSVQTTGFIWSGSCSAVVTGLTPNTIYYFQAYAYGKSGEILSFTTLSSGVTPTPTPTTGGGIKVQMYNNNRSATSNTVYGLYKLVNTGTSAITLSNVKIRYYYTIDGVKPQSFFCDYSPIGSNNVTGTFVSMTTPKTGADSYLEISFTTGAGSLAAGGSVEIQTRFAKTDWTNYTQTNDYSFNPTATAYVDWSKVTAYVSGTLAWGTEP